MMNEENNNKLTPEELEAYYSDPEENEENAFERFADNNPSDTYQCKGGKDGDRHLGGGEPEMKIRMALLDYVEDPFQKKKDISARWGIEHGHFLRALKVYDTWIQKESERVWKSKKPQMMRKMEELAVDDKNFKALEFVLRSLGVNPEKKISIDETDINVTINKD